MSNAIPIVIGLAAKKRHGKNMTAILIRDLAEPLGYNVIERAFADALKEECAAMIAPHHPTKSYEKILSEMYADETKEQYRLLLQWHGTEFRRTQNPNYWLDRMDDWLTANAYSTSNTIVCITDVRFPNEVAYVRKQDQETLFEGYVVKINRTDLPPATDPHISEIALDDYKNWDSVITNTVDPDDPARSIGWLNKEVQRVFNHITRPAFGVKNQHHLDLVGSR